MADHLRLEEAALLRELRPGAAPPDKYETFAGVRLVEPDDITSPLTFEYEGIDDDDLAQEAFEHFLEMTNG